MTDDQKDGEVTDDEEQENNAFFEQKEFTEQEKLSGESVEKRDFMVPKEESIKEKENQSEK
jgi:hypothetical protein